MAPFYGWVQLPHCFEEGVYFLPLSSQKSQAEVPYLGTFSNNQSCSGISRDIKAYWGIFRYYWGILTDSFMRGILLYGHAPTHAQKCLEVQYIAGANQIFLYTFLLHICLCLIKYVFILMLLLNMLLLLIIILNLRS